MVITFHLHQIWLAMKLALASHSEEKKFKCTYPKCSKSYKTKAEYNCHFNHRHKQKSAESQEIKCNISDKIFSKVKYLKKHMKSHMDDLPFGCHYCGKHFKWRSGHKLHIDVEHKKKVLVMNFILFYFFYLVVFFSTLCMYAQEFFFRPC